MIDMAKNYIPQYGSVNYGKSPLNFNGFFDVIDTIQRRQEYVRQDKRNKIAQANAAIEKYNPGELWHEKHQTIGAEIIDAYQTELANALTFERDEKGGFTKKIRRYFGTEPSFTDQEYADMIQKAGKIAETFEKWKKDEELTKKETDAFKSAPKGKFDSEKFRIYMDHYEQTGDRLPGSALDVAPENVMTFTPGLDPRDAQEKLNGKTETLSKDGSRIITTTPGIDSDTQKAIYFDEANNNPAYQKGLVDKMISDGSMNSKDKLAYMRGVLYGPEVGKHDIDALRYKASQLPEWSLTKEEQTALAADAKIREALDNYYTLRDFDPLLIESAKYYGATELRLPDMIGPSTTKEDLNMGYINSQMRKTEEEKNKIEEEKMPPQERTITVPGTNIKFQNAVDLSSTPEATRSINGFQVPKGAIKITTDSEGRTVTEKKFEELKNQDDYIVDWYDKKAGFIQLKKKVKDEDQFGNKITPPYFVVPVEGNEYLLTRIKSFEYKPETKTAGRYD